MTNLKRITCTALAIALATAFLGTSPAGSAPGGEHIPPPSSCLDVVETSHGNVETNEDTDAVRNLLGTAAPTTTTVTFSIDLAAPSCTDGVYEISVFDNDADNTLLDAAQLPGNGTHTVETSFTLEDSDPDECVKVLVTTRNAQNRIIDIAPDDGAPGALGAGCGGGGSVWK